MRRSDIVSALIILGSGFLLIFVIIPNQTSGGEKYGLPPAFFPTLSISVVTILSGLLLIKSLWRLKGHTEVKPMTSRNWTNLLLTTCLLFLSLGLFKYLGYVLGGILTISFFMLYTGERKLLSIAIPSLLTPIVIYFLLQKLLWVSLP